MDGASQLVQKCDDVNVQDQGYLVPEVPADRVTCPPAPGHIGGGGMASGIPDGRAQGGGTGGGKEPGGSMPGGGSPDPNDDATGLGAVGGGCALVNS